MSTERIRLGISACLLGQEVRYDGQHKLDPFLRDTLGAFMDYVPVCPEVECGLGVPREAMRLVGDPAAPRLVTIRSGRDLTDTMLAWVACRLDELEKENLAGYIFKSRSPSSGMENVKVYGPKGGAIGRSAGLFAGAFMRRFPLLPAEDEGRLHDPDLRENFIERVFTLHRYRAAVRDGVTARALTEFHARQKYLLMAHSPARTSEMGRALAAGAKNREAAARLARDYEAALLAAMRIQATPAKHANVMHHLLGHLRERLTADENLELRECIEQYRDGLTPLIVPLTLIRHYVRKYDVPYLKDQTYLNPHPAELKLRNHA